MFPSIGHELDNFCYLPDVILIYFRLTVIVKEKISFSTYGIKFLRGVCISSTWPLLLACSAGSSRSHENYHCSHWQQFPEPAHLIEKVCNCFTYCTERLGNFYPNSWLQLFSLQVVDSHISKCQVIAEDLAYSQVHGHKVRKSVSRLDSSGLLLDPVAWLNSYGVPRHCVNIAPGTFSV